MQVLNWPMPGIAPWIKKVRKSLLFRLRSISARIGGQFQAPIQAQIGPQIRAITGSLTQSRIPAAVYARAQRLLRQGALLARRSPLSAMLALIIGLGLSISAYVTVQGLYRTEAQKSFEGSAVQLTGAVSQSLDRYLEVVNAVGAFFAASKDVDRWEFFEFSRDTLPRFPGVTALAWVPWVPDEAREAFEARAHADGLFGFQFKDPQSDPLTAGTAGGAVAPAHDGYFPVFYVEPFEGNAEQLGLDLGGRPDDLAVLSQARDSGQAAIARPGAGVGESVGAGSAQPGFAPSFVVVLPVYRSGEVPQSLEERRAELLGFARAEIALPDLIAAAMPRRAAARDLDVYIYDEAAAPGDRLLAFHPAAQRGAGAAALPEAEVRQGLFAVTGHAIAGQDWSIVAKSADDHLPAHVQAVAWAVFAVGLLMTLWLAQFLTSSHIRTRLIERAVTKRTGELRESNRALETEIHERERVESKLREAKELAEMASRAKSDFLAMMSHELRTPLNAVIGFSEILRDQSLGPLGNDQYLDYAEHIRSSGTELLARINDILELTKIDGNDFTLSVEPVSLVEVAQAVEPLVREKASAAGLDFSVDIAPDLPRLEADPRALKQVLLNLLQNAVKFTLAGGRVALDARLDSQERITLRVADSGVGIDAEHLSQVLQPFSQADSSLGRKYEGSGLGLALAHKLVTLHRAELTIDSEVGVGTTVTIVFPRERTLDRPSESQVA